MLRTPGRQARLVRIALAMALALSTAGAGRLAPAANAGGTGCLILQDPHATANDDGPDLPWWTTEDGQLSLTSPTVLSNDQCTDGVQSVNSTNFSGGSWSIGVNATNFIPTANFFGTATATYYFTSSEWGQSNTATVRIEVEAVNDAPTIDVFGPACSPTITVAEDSGQYTSLCQPRGYPAAASNTYEAGQAITGHASAANPDLFSVQPKWTLDESPDSASITFTPKANAHGSTTISIWVTDNGGTSFHGVDRSTDTSFDVTITSVDDPPVANNDSYSTPRGQVLVVPVASGVLDNDTDVDGPARTASKVSGPSHGVAALQSDGSFTYTPQAGYTGADSFTYRATSGGLSDTATVSITVLAPGATAPPTPRPTTPPTATDKPTAGATADPGSTADTAASADPAVSIGPSGVPVASGAAPSTAPSGRVAGSPAPSGAATTGPSTSPVVDPGSAAGGDIIPWILVAILGIALAVAVFLLLRDRRSAPAPPSSG